MSKNLSKETIVYYSPYSVVSNTNWDILHEEPMRVFDYLKPKLNPQSDFNYLSCPATQHISKKTFKLINTLDSKYIIENNEIIGTSKNFIDASITRVPSLINQKLIALSMNWIFFTEEESLTMTLLPPIMEKAPHLQYGAIVTGSFNIGKYLRQIGIEYNLWENVNKFEIKKDEPYAYVMFDSDKPIKLVRFVVSPKMKEYVDVMTLSSGWEKKVSLIDRYKRFKAANMKKLVLHEIKNNLIGEQ
jgi:hypothetical protein